MGSEPIIEDAREGLGAIIWEQAARIAELEAAVKALGDCIKATCKKHRMEVATLAILNNPIAAAAVREAGR